MLRAIFTMLVMSVLVVLFGTPLLLLGFFYPSKRFLAFCSNAWSRAVLWCAGARLTIEGWERIADGAPRFYLGNHQSALDIPIAIAGLRGHVRFMAKDTLFKIPLFGWVIGQYGYAPVDRSNARNTHKTLERMFERLKRNPVSLAVFPEGTRSRTPRMGPFRRGTIKVAQRSGLPVVPFSIDGSIHVHHRDRLAAIPGPVKLTFAEPIPAEEVAAMTQSELHDRIRATIARQLGQTEEPVGNVEQGTTLPSAVERIVA